MQGPLFCPNCFFIAAQGLLLLVGGALDACKSPWRLRSDLLLPDACPTICLTCCAILLQAAAKKTTATKAKKTPTKKPAAKKTTAPKAKTTPAKKPAAKKVSPVQFCCDVLLSCRWVHC